MVAVGGSRPVDGGTFYTNTRNYEAVLLDVRARTLEIDQVQTRKSYLSTILNYGNLDEEMSAEIDTNVRTPSANASYTDNGLGAGVYELQEGTPLFLENMFASSVRYVGLTDDGSGTNIIQYDPLRLESRLAPGMEVEINGETRTIGFVNATNFTLTAPLSVSPGTGSLILVKGREYTNPHLNETYRVTDNYSSYNVDENRYQVDRVNGLVRYRPAQGNFAPGGGLPASLWHPEAALETPYYLGRMLTVSQTPPSSVVPPGGVLSNPPVGPEELGNPVDPLGNAVVYDGTPGTTTDFNLPIPNGDYSNITVSSPDGVPFEVELNGAKLAVSNRGGTVTIPFFDPNFENDQLKANEGIDPDIYIQRFVKEGNNHLVIKATETADAGGNRGISVEGLFNGVELSTADSSTSIDTLDWSVSKRSILGVVGKVEFELRDQVALEQVNDEIQKAKGALESLTTIIAATDVNQLQSILSVIR